MKNLTYTSKRTLTALCIASALLSACGNNKQEKEAQKEEEQQQSQMEIPKVNPVAIHKGKLQATLQVPGELLPYNTVNLYAKINSYVKQYLVDIGSQVHKGQLMVTLEAPEINSQLAQAQSRIKQQEAIYLADKATYDRLYNTSKTPGTVAQNDLDQAAARKNSDYANVEAARASYREVQANLAYLQIRAPFDGVVTQRNVNAGAYVGPSGTGSSLPLFVVQEQKLLRLAISVPELNTSGLSHQDHVTFHVREIPNVLFTAKVKRLAGAIDERLRSERVEMDVINNNRRLLPGMYAEVDVPMQSHDSTFVVPKTAVVISTEKVFVIRITDNHRAQWVDVQKGLESKGQMEIFSKELKEGDRLINNATDEIRDGQPVDDRAGQNGEGGTQQGGTTAGGSNGGASQNSGNGAPQGQSSSGSAGQGSGKGGKKGGGQSDDGEKNMGQERTGENPDNGKGGSSQNKGGKQAEYGNGGKVGG